jgi:hypothetical protein
VVSKGVDAFGKLRNLGTIPESAIANFTTSLQTTMSAFGAMTQQWDKRMMSAASQFTFKSNQVIETMTKGVEMLLKLADFKAIPQETIGAFGVALDAAMQEMVRISTRTTLIGLAGAQAFAESAGKIVAVIGPAVDGFASLADLTTLPAGRMKAFADMVLGIVFRLWEVSERLRGDMVAAAAAFAEGAGKVMGILKTGTEGLSALADLTTLPAGRMQMFAEMVVGIVYRLWEVSRRLSEDAVAAAATFSEGAGKVLSMIGSGVDGLLKLADFKAPATGAIAAFADTLGNLVAYLYSVAQQFSDDAAQAAGSFSEAAGKAVAMVGQGVEGLMKLADYRAPSTVAIEAFANTVADVVSYFWSVSEQFAAEGVQAAGAFAEGAGKAISIIGGAVDGFMKLYDFQVVPQQAILAFKDSLWRVFEEMVQVSEGWTDVAYREATKFAEGAGKSIAMIGGAVDSIAKLQDFKAIPQQAILAFKDSLWRAFEEMVQVSEGWTDAAYTEATKFAEGAGKAIAMIGVAVDNISKIADFKSIPQQAILAFKDSLWRAFEEMVQVSEGWTDAAFASATRFATGAQAVISTIVQTIDAFAKLGNFKAEASGVFASFTAGMTALLAEVQKQALPAATNVGAHVMISMSNGIVAQLPQTLATARAAAAAIGQALQPIGAFGLAGGITGGGHVTVVAQPSVNVTFASGAIQVSAPAGASGQDLTAFANQLAYQILLIIQQRTGMRLVG